MTTDSVPVADSVSVPTYIDENGNGDTKSGLPFVALADLLDEPEDAVQYVVNDLLPAGGLSLLAGKPKAGKSTLARCLALSVARGETWLGRECRQGTVLYLGLEEKRSEVRRHFAGLGADKEPVYCFIEGAPQKNATNMLEAAFDLYKPVLAIVDPLARFARVKDGSDYSEVTRSLEPLGELARRSGVHVALVHHARKNTEGGPGDDALGSVGYMAAVDCGDHPAAGEQWAAYHPQCEPLRNRSRREHRHVERGNRMGDGRRHEGRIGCCCGAA